MKKGFTIIEVLAVIVVMTLLTVLIVPNIINSVNNKRADVSEASKKIIYDAADLYVTANRVSFPIAEDATYCVKLETLVNNGNLVAPVKDLKSDKEIPLNYYVKVTLDSYEQYNYELVSECTEVGGAISDTTPPTIASVSLKTKTSNSITVVANGYDQESGISHYQFSKDDGKTWTKVQESNEYTFSNLSTGTYKIKSRVINGSYDNKLTNKNYKDSDTNEIETGVITVPIYTIDKVGWQTSKTVTITYPEGEGLTKQYSLDGGNNWQTYTNPVTFTENGTILARVTDGTNTVTGYINGSSYAVSGIDTTGPSKPSISLNTSASGNPSYTSGDWTQYNVLVDARSTDEGSGVAYYQYSNDGTNWHNINDTDWSKALYSDNTIQHFWLVGSRNQNFWIRSIDELGNISLSSDNFIVRIDQTVPTITMNSGTYDLTNTNNIYSATFGSMGGSVSCINQSRSNNSVTTYKSINILGRNTISCTATGNNGKTATANAIFTMNFTSTDEDNVRLHGTNGAYKSGTSIIIPNGGIQYGPYIKANAGCYRVFYNGNNLNVSTESYDVYEGNGVRYTITNLNYVSSNSNYYIYISQDMTGNGLETVLGNSSSSTTTVSAITIQYVGTSCS